MKNYKIIKTIIGIIFLQVVNSCFQKVEITFEERVNKSISEYFANRIDDPETFEFVEITDVDTITFKEHLLNEIYIFSASLENKENRLKQADELEKVSREILQYLPGDSSAEMGIEDAEKMRVHINEAQSKVDSLTELLNMPDSNKIEFIQLFYKFRMNNSEGVKNLYTFFVKLNENLSVKSVSEVKEE